MTTPPTRPVISRRQFLALAGMLPIGGILAACGQATATPTTTTAATVEPAAPTSTAAPTVPAATASPLTSTAAEPTAEVASSSNSTAVAAATALLALLDDSQRSAVSFAFDNNEQRVRRSNFPTGIFQRAGLRMGDLSEAQREAVYAVLAATLSSEGYQQVRAPITAGLGTHELSFFNGHQPVKSSYQANALQPTTDLLSIATINHADQQQTITIDYRLTAAPETAQPAAANSSASSAWGVEPIIATLAGTSHWPWWSISLLALLLGALHALTPGHGKTIVAAYLVGSRGTPQHALLLGVMVTLTHTSAVFAIGLAALLLGNLIAIETLTTMLEVGAGVLVLLLGIQLLWQRGRQIQHPYSHDHAHPHSHDHAHPHSHDHSHPHSHAHGHGHHHHLPTQPNLKGLIALGVSGGLTPCPEALGIMLVAISLGQIWSGLGLILAFSLGLAATIIAIGLGVVLAGKRLQGFNLLDRAWVRWLPLGSAVLITMLGGVMTIRSLLH
ncbi:MAG: hypothetical protein Fur005_40070 [Roseiflexaceae bacterium]